MRRVIESIVLEPGRIALRYWTSNELRDDSQHSKTKKASDSKSGATVLPFREPNFSSNSPSLTPTRDDVVSCSDIVRQMYFLVPGLHFIPGTWFTLFCTVHTCIVRFKPERIVLWGKLLTELVEIAQIKIHKSYKPDSVVNLFESHGLIG